LTAALGGARRSQVPLYANINRRTRDRSPEGFAASATQACNAGFTAIKMAPFDEVTVETIESGTAQKAADRGLARIAAVRSAIDARELLVDCHWRFDKHSAHTVLTECAARGVCWFECPLPESEDNIPDIVALRASANRHGMRLAGGEKLVRLAAFAPFIAAGAYDVMMPDIKYVGGLAEALRLAKRLQAAGIAFSPHNPSGPVAHAASIQLCAAAPALDRLEMQWNESPLFEALVDPSLPTPQNGSVNVPLESPGIGVNLNRAVLLRNSPKTAASPI